jgi:hypothetical protein
MTNSHKTWWTIVDLDGFGGPGSFDIKVVEEAPEIPGLALVEFRQVMSSCFFLSRPHSAGFCGLILRHVHPFSSTSQACQRPKLT